MSDNSDKLGQAIVRLVNLAAKLRGPGGCPWDAKQTDDSIKLYLLEEAYEVVEAIESSTPPEVCSELGDLLFQIIFLALLAEERGEFNFLSVVEKIEEKMIRRHPHVFGSVKVKDAEDVAQNWAKIKEEEKKGQGNQASSLRKIPSALPALLRAHRIWERIQKLNFLTKDHKSIIEDIEKELDRLKEALNKQDKQNISTRIGKILFLLAALSQQTNNNAEDLLRKAINQFLEDVEELENSLLAKGISLKDANPEQVAREWDKIKKII